MYCQGTYFYLDSEDRAIVSTTRNTVLVIQVPEPGGEFELVENTTSATKWSP